MKKKKGITLVSLIVTIIILLLLAGITINVVIGQEGIIQRAKQAGIDQEKAQIKEELELKILDIEFQKKSQKQEIVREDLKGLEEIGAVMKIIGTPAIGKYKNYFFEVDEEYKVTIIENIELIVTPQISVKSVTHKAFTITIENHYNTLVTEYRYYINDTLMSENTTNQEFEVTGLEAETEYANIYVEAIIDGKKLQSNILTVTTKEPWSEVYTSTQLNNYEDSSGKKATIPEGFQTSLKIGETEIATGLVIREAETKNEYVWVPCALDTTNGSIKFNRYVFLSAQPSSGTDSSTKSTKIKYKTTESDFFKEAIQSDESTSVEKYGGYYIGRYETGIKGYENVTMTNSSSAASWTGYDKGTVAIQKGKQVWNYVTRDKAKTILQEMYENNTSVISKLCSSYAWDTAVKFVQTTNSDYAKNSIEGNYEEIQFEYIDLEGNTQTKSKNSTILVPTGQTTPVNNIYDLGGNAYEFTTESFSSGLYTFRGGDYGGSASSRPAGYRSKSSTTGYAGENIGFRATLFIL